MISVTHLAQYLLKLDPQKSVPRLTFYHYLKNFCDLNAPVTAELINQFYAQALTFQYWQTHQESLGQVIEADLKSFNEQSKVQLEIGEIRHAHQVQVLQLKHSFDYEKVVKAETEEASENGDKLKQVKLSDHQILCLNLKATGNLQVKIFGNSVTVSGGILKLLAPTTELEYNSQLELMPKKMHVLESNLMTTARFQVNEDGCFGLFVRGYSFQKYETINGGSLSQHPELFYNLKRIERHFINPQSDPFYQELIGILEKSYQLLTAGHPDGVRMGEAALQRGQMALKSIFPNDKLLLLLVTNIEYWLITQGKRRPATDRLEEKWQNIKPLNS